MKQRAVEWLFDNLNISGGSEDMKALQQAKAMEKEQELKEWIETWSLGYNSGWDNCMKKFKQQEQ